MALRKICILVVYSVIVNCQSTVSHYLIFKTLEILLLGTIPSSTMTESMKEEVL